ncbi:MAG TPA: hypothetical protein VMT45_02360 [Thermoanaerobaculaceae bacterium]|nr:hypothetical protein [Thermoanaerobaculaceae bacterium]
MTRNELTLAVLLVAGVLAVAARAQAPLSYAGDVEPIIVKACAECHGGDNPKKGLDLSKGKGYERLVAVKSQEVPEMVLVKAGDPAGSFLWLKVTHTATQGKGMPRTLFGSKKLPESELDVIRNWIIQGANP